MDTKQFAGFTPGPWRVNGSEQTTAIWVETADGKRICTVRNCDSDADVARLIAAAPELLAEVERLQAVNAELVAALDRILRAHDSKNNGAVMGEAVLCEQFAAHARYALSKAKGE